MKYEDDKLYFDIKGNDIDGHSHAYLKPQWSLATSLTQKGEPLLLHDYIQVKLKVYGYKIGKCRNNFCMVILVRLK